MSFNIYSSSDALNESFASEIIRELQRALDQRGKAYCVVSGGKTPLGLFSILSKSDLDWEAVSIILADERCVSSDNQDSNEFIVRKYLLQNKAAKAQFVPLYRDNISLEELLQERIEEIGSLPRFDVVILGMGADAHTASLFPCSSEIELALSERAPAVLSIRPQTAPYQRISLSKKRLMDSHLLYVHIIGEDKRKAFDRAKQETNPMNAPISAFLSKKDVRIMYAPQ